MSSSSGSAGRAIGVRFAIVVGAVFTFPFPIGALPGTEWLETQLAKPLEGLAAWLGQIQRSRIANSAVEARWQSAEALRCHDGGLER